MTVMSCGCDLAITVLESKIIGEYLEDKTYVQVRKYHCLIHDQWVIRGILCLHSSGVQRKLGFIGGHTDAIATRMVKLAGTNGLILHFCDPCYEKNKDLKGDWKVI